MLTRPKRFEWHWFVGGACALVFAVLFSWRLGVFSQKVEMPVFTRQPVKAGETWMNVLQKGRKIGYVHRVFQKAGRGYHLVDSAMMRINTMGTIQDINFNTDGYLKSDLTLDAFHFDLRSNLFRFTARGTVQDKKMIVYTGMPGREKKIEIPVQEPPRLSVSLFDSLRLNGIKEGQSSTFRIFDPSTMGQIPVTATVEGFEIITISGRKQKARKVSVTVMGTRQTAWLDGSGDVLREEGFLGITLEKATKEEATGGIALTASTDLVEAVSLASGRILDDPLELTELRIRLDGPAIDAFALDGGRQTYRGGIVTVRREPLPSKPYKAKAISIADRAFLRSSPFIQADDPVMKKKAREIVSPGDNTEAKAKKLVGWLYNHIEKRPVISVPDALETLKNMVGDCNEHAVLLAALARSAGIPAQVEAGIVYQRGRFYYHAWNCLLIDGTWVTADAALGQLPADVTHIRLIRGALERQIDLLGVIGKLHLTITEAS